MANKEFLEIYPLYRKFFGLNNFNRYTDVQNIPKPAIHMYCPVCDSEQTFNMVNEYYEVDNLHGRSLLDTVLRLKYVCSSCGQGMRIFLVHFSETKRKFQNPKTGEEEERDTLYIMKVGQIPAWDIKMDSELEAMLGEHADAYKKGLICESQNYGIGAYAYFRRVTEDIIDELLESILDLVPTDEKDEYKKKLEGVKKEKIAENKINLVKDLLPEPLKADGMNPLKELYKVLSDGIHDKTDEECMEKAEAIRG
ncbi:MAG: hypothetical protein AAB907_02255, partial [Patescibacteria group bacterium]